VEELLNYLHDQGLNLRDLATLDAMDLPTSLHSLLLSRMDQLDDRQQITLKVASIIGRVFRVAWLHAYYPALGELPEIIADLELLSQLDLTAPEAPAPALTYVFKHVVTQEVAYESLSYATRARLHEQFARYLEAERGADTGPALDRLAYHYTRSANVPKQREYLRRAGDAASVTYANEPAIDYYERLLPLLNEPAAQVDVLLALETVLERVGRWEAAEARARQALDLAVACGDRQVQARCEQALGIVLGKRGEYHASCAWLKRAQQGGDATTQMTALIGLGQAATVKSDYAQATDYLQDALGLAQAAGDQRMASDTLSRLSHVAFLRGAYTEMHHLAEAAHACALAAGDLSAQALALRRMGVAAFSVRDATLAAHYAEQSLALSSQIGDREGIAACLVNLGHAARIRGDYVAAKRYAERGLRLSRELGDRHSAGIALFNMGFVANAEGDYAAAAKQFAEGLAHAQALSDRRLIGICLHGLGFAAAGVGDVRAAERYYHAALAETIGSGGLTIVLWVIVGIAQLQLRAGQPERAVELIGLVLGHPASGADTAQLAEPVLEAARAALTAEALEAALARGHPRDLEAVVAELLAGVESARSPTS
jgi:predicted ATPase